MANLFPLTNEPDVWEPTPVAFQERDVSKSGGLQINAYDPAIQWGFRAVWNGTLPRADYDLIEDHWWANRAGTFSLYDFRKRKLRDVFVAIADGVSLSYSLPAKSVVGPSIKHNNVVAASQPSLVVGTGTEGSDVILYTSGTKPAAGVVITLTASDGQQKFEVNYGAPGDMGSPSFPGRDSQADLRSLELAFSQKVLA